MAPTARTPHCKNEAVMEENQNIAVFVRCRPMKATEKKNVVEVYSERREVRVVDYKTTNVCNNIISKNFTFDHAFGQDANQIDVYKHVVAPLIEQVTMGYNCTVFAYGQTGTGKTYTMEGERTDQSCSWESDPSSGMIPRALHQLFEYLTSEQTEHTVRVSFLEMYNEELYDLLSPLDDTTKLKIYEDAARKGSIIVGGLEEITVHSKAEIYEILKKGSAKRQTAATLLNACSSRSHTIFSVTVHIKESSMDGEDLLKIGKLNLVDLAGSENIGRSGAIDKRAREAGNINQSLLTLGRVITSLVEKAPHIPYRESKLTRILQDSLGGKTKTSIIATISPSAADYEDTLSTLDYAHRAKKITNKPEINQRMTKKTLLREYTAEIERLRRDLLAARERNGIYVNEENYNAMQEQIRTQTEEIEAKMEEIRAFQEEIEKITALFEETKVTLGEKERTLEETAKNLEHTVNKLDKTKKQLRTVIVDRNEKKHLVNVHVATEEKLSSQAKSLLEVADLSTNHVSGLHEKVDRQKSVQEQNKEKLEMFRETFNIQMQRLENLVGIQTSNCKDSLEEFREDFQANCQAIDKELNALYRSLKDNKEILDDRCQQLELVHSKDQIVVSEQFLSLENKNRHLHEIIKEKTSKIDLSLSQNNEAILKKMNKLMEVVLQQRSEMEEKIMQQSSQIELISRVQQDMLSSMKETLQEMFAKQREQLEDFSSEIETSKNKRKQAQTSINATLMNLHKGCLEMFKHIENVKQQCDNDFENSHLTSERLFSKNQTNKACIDEIEITLSSNVEECLKKIETGQKLSMKRIEETDTLSTENAQTIIDACASFKNEREEWTQKGKETIKNSEKEVLNEISSSRALINEAQKFFEGQQKEKKESLSKLKADVDQEIETELELSEATTDALKTVSDSATDKIAEIARIATTMEQSYGREINSRIKDFERFVKYDFLECSSTGRTPQKANYSYPRELVATSPHERILERFRMDSSSGDLLNTSLIEESEPETPSPSSEAASVHSSRSSSPSNNENIPVGLTRQISKSKLIKKHENDSFTKGKKQSPMNGEENPKHAFKVLNN